jgi:arylsulfatase A
VVPAYPRLDLLGKLAKRLKKESISVMKRVVFFFALLLSLTLASVLATDKPNVIVILADDIGYECYGVYGSAFYSTPNIDKLASTGARFTQAYSQPLCTPSRVKIMTGRYNFRNYVTFGRLDLEQPTFAKMVKANGYSTCVAGKWQLSELDLEGPYKAGFDEYCLWHFAPEKKSEQKPSELFRNKGSRYKSPKLFRDGELVSETEGLYGPDLVTDYILDFIERKKDEPFLVYYPMFLVHSPFDPTPVSPDWEVTDKDRGALPHFKEMVNYMDKNVGRIVDRLEYLGLRDDTLIIVTGDNGTNKAIASPFPGRGEIQGGKGLLTDAGTRVAFAANWKGRIKPGTVVDSLVDFADVLPTIAEVTGSTVPVGSDGQSLMPLLRGDTSHARDFNFMSYSSGGPDDAPYRCFVRDKRWKLYAHGLLYDVPNDWLEQTPATGLEADQARKRLQPILDRILQDAPKGFIQYDAKAKPPPDRE